MKKLISFSSVTSLITLFSITANAGVAGVSETKILKGIEAEKANDYVLAASFYNDAMVAPESREKAIQGLTRVWIHENKLELAESKLREIISVEMSFSVPVRISLVDVLVQAEKFDVALKELKYIEELRPSSEVVIEKRGDVFAKMKNYDAAIAEYNKILKSNPASFSPMLSRGWAKVEKGEYAQAVAEAKHLLEIRPMSVEAKTLMGVAQLGNADYKSAQETLTVVLKNDPTSLLVNEKLGDLYTKTGKHSTAVEFYSKCVSLAPNKLEVGLKLAGSYLATNQRKLAEEEFVRELKVLPSYDHAAYGLVKIYLDEKRVDDAGKFLAEYNSKFKFKTWVMVSFAKLLASVNNLDYADALTKKNIVESRKPEAYIMHAFIKSKKGELNKSIEALEDAQSLYPNDSKVRFNLALLYQKSGNVSDAIEMYGSIAKTDPVYQVAKTNLVYLLNKQGKSEEAKTVWNGELPANRKVASTEESKNNEANVKKDVDKKSVRAETYKSLESDTDDAAVINMGRDFASVVPQKEMILP